MPDNLTKKQRSETMSKIRSKWTTQEQLAHNWLKKKKIKHIMHPEIEGRPDIIIPEKRIAVFLHGCFWHACRICYVEPKSNRKYWIPKINANKKRDKNNEKLLKSREFRVKTIWEHEIKRDLNKACSKIAR